MVWFTQPLQRKGKDGAPLPLWHLCAQSDEGGGFHVGCDHDHATAEEAVQCIEARKRLGGITGIPLRIDRITINGKAHEWPHEDPLLHEEICRLAGQPEHASVVYSVDLAGDVSRSGTTYRGKSIRSDNGMRITCVVTGAA